MFTPRFLFRALTVVWIYHLNLALSSPGHACCLKANKTASFTKRPPEGAVCGQEYSSSLPAAPELFVSFQFCKAHCSGIGFSRVGIPGQWAPLLVQFILPAVIFSMNIPRRKKFEAQNVAPRFGTGSQWLSRLSCELIAVSKFVLNILLVPLILDTMATVVNQTATMCHRKMTCASAVISDATKVSYVTAP